MATIEPGVAAPKTGMGTGTKIVLWILGLGGLSTLACCGGCFWSLRNAASDDPADVIATTTEIIPIEIPGEVFKPAGRFKLTIPFMATTTIVAYEAVEGDGALVLFAIQAKGAVDETEMQEAMSKQNFDTGEKELDIIRSETRVLKVAGQDVDFKFTEAKDPKDDKLFRQIKGGFRNGDTFILFVVQVEEEHYDEETILAMIDSMN